MDVVKICVITHPACTRVGILHGCEVRWQSLSKKEKWATHRETRLYVTPNAIDSWTDELFSFISQVRRSKLTEQGLTIVKICNSYVVKKKGFMLECRPRRSYSLNVLANPKAMFSKSPKWKGFVASHRKCRGTGINPKSFGTGLALLFDWDCPSVVSACPPCSVGSAIVVVAMAVGWNGLSSEPINLRKMWWG